MSFEFNVGYRNAISSKNLNDKIHMILGKNTLFSGFQLAPYGDNKISISPGTAVIQGCVITEQYSTNHVTLPISNVSGGEKYIIYLRYIRGSGGVADQCTIQYALEGTVIGDNELLLGTVFRPYQTAAVTDKDVVSSKEYFSPLSQIGKQIQEATKFEKAGGTPTAITLKEVSLIDGVSKTFIVSGNNNGNATTINGLPLYKPNSTTSPKLTAGKAETVWYDATGNCYYIQMSADEIPMVSDTAPGLMSTDNYNKLVNGTYTKTETDAKISTTITEQLSKKVDKVDGKGLSTNDYTTAAKNKVDATLVTVKQATAPSNTSYLWLDTSTGLWKYYNGSAWVATKAVWG